MQPVVIDGRGTHRFQANAVVRYLLDNGGLDLNKLEVAYQTGDGFPPEDMRQFMQLIGYSVSGLAGLTDYRDVNESNYAELDAGLDAARPENSDGECIARALDASLRAWRDTGTDTGVAAQIAIGEIDRILRGSPSGERWAAAVNS